MPDDHQAASSSEASPCGDAAGKQGPRGLLLPPRMRSVSQTTADELAGGEDSGLRRRSTSRKSVAFSPEAMVEETCTGSESLQTKKLRRSNQRAATVFDEHLQPLVSDGEDTDDNGQGNLMRNSFSEGSSTSSQKRRRASTEPNMAHNEAIYGQKRDRRTSRPRRSGSKRGASSQKADVACRLFSPFPATTASPPLQFVKLTWRAHLACKAAGASLSAWLVYLARVQGLGRGSMFELDLNGDQSLSGIEVAWLVGSVAGLVTGLVMLSRFFLHQYGQYLHWLKAINHSYRFKKLEAMSPFALPRSHENEEPEPIDHSLVDYLNSHFDTVGQKRSGDARRKNTFPDPEGTPTGDDDLSVSQRVTRRTQKLDRQDTTTSVSEYISVVDLAVLSTASHDISGIEVSAGLVKPKSPSGSAVADKTSHCSRVPRCSFDAVLSKEVCDVTASKLREFTFKFPEWNFDIFEVNKVTHRPLAFTGFVCLDAYSKLVQVDKKKMVEFLNDVEDSYRQIPYHNSLHGASVARCVYSFCAGYGLAFAQEHFEFTLVLAALVHDVHHPGLTPTFLSKASAEGAWKMTIQAPLEEADMDLALKYNDQSPLENMHCAVALELLRNPKNTFLAKEDVGAIRQPLIRAILATDMAKHAENMTRLSALIDNLNHDGDEGALPWYWPSKRPANVKTDEEQEEWARALQEQFILETFLHAADLSGPTFPFPQWLEWNKRVQREFHIQGDLEREEFGELISPPSGFDRNARPEQEHGFTKGFMQYLALPLFEQLNDLTQVQSSKSVVRGVNLSVCLENLHSNLRQWDTHTIDRTEQAEDKEPSTSSEEGTMVAASTL